MNLETWRSIGMDQHSRVADPWYRIAFDVPETLRGRKAVLFFGAADEIATVYLNGKEIGQHGPHPGSWDHYFSFDVTDTVRPGEKNVLAVSVVSAAKFGGIWKGVRLITPKEEP